MVMRRRRGGYKKKGGVRRRRANVNSSGGLVRALRTTLVPDRMLLRMSYKDNINLTGVAPSTFSIKEYRLNSIYDPDTSIINGHQPLGYDQWAYFYNQYRVYKVQVSVTFLNNQGGALQCAIVPFNAQKKPTYDDSIFEQPHVKTKTIGGMNGQNRGVISATFSPPRILGQSSLQYKTSNDTAAQFGYNPVEEMRAWLVARVVNDSAAPGASAVINITYFVELFDRTIQSMSYPAGKDPIGWDLSGNAPDLLPPQA